MCLIIFCRKKSKSSSDLLLFQSKFYSFYLIIISLFVFIKGIFFLNDVLFRARVLTSHFGIFIVPSILPSTESMLIVFIMNFLN